MTTPKTLLLIDDEKDIVLMLKTILEEAGYRILTAFNGEEGLKVLTKHKPDLIVLDMNMPKMGGVPFYEKLVLAGRGKPLYPVLALTARANLEQLFRELEIDGFMTKPFETDDLLQEIQAILDKKSKPVSAGRVRPLNQPRKIVIIENDAALLKNIQVLFITRGYTVVAADSGSSGIERVKAEKPDVALVKMNLPDLSGDYVSAVIKRMSVTTDTLVVLYTSKFYGFDRTVLEKISSSAGACSHAVESNDPESLLQACEEALKSRDPQS